MKMLMLILLSLFTASAYAVEIDSLYLDVNGLSKHSSEVYSFRGKKYNFNEQNPGLGVTFSLRELFPEYLEITSGWYKNSYSKNTIYFGGHLKRSFIFGDFVITPKITIGFATGYKETPMNADILQITVVPNMQLRYKNVGFSIGYVPASFANTEHATVSIVILQFNFKVK